jgi:peptide/nickel transport system substrate-binding protein
MWDQPSAAQESEIQADYPSQLHVNTIDAVFFFSLNTRVKPFTSLDVRKALNYAVDRSLMVGPLAFGPLGGRITCQTLPPRYLSYRPYCPYTLSPSPNGAADIVTAQRLVARSGMRGTPVTINTNSGISSGRPARVLALALNELGFPG